MTAVNMENIGDIFNEKYMPLVWEKEDDTTYIGKDSVATIKVWMGDDGLWDYEIYDGTMVKPFDYAGGCYGFKSLIDAIKSARSMLEQYYINKL